MSSDKFIKYTSIENHYQQGFITKCPQEEYCWCVTEKIHGANFQVFYDGVNFLLGSRNRFINTDESFNNLKNLIDVIKENILNLCETIGAYPITLYGEVYGDGVQKGVKYSKEKKIKFFDIKIQDDYVPYIDAEELFEKFEIPYVPVIETKNGTLAAISELANSRFNSTIAEGEYSELETNICEGVVIKPYTKELKNYMGSRIIIKKKNEEFFEKSKVPASKPDRFIDYQEDINKALPFINQNRFNSVFSKDIYKKENFGEFLKAYAEDVITDAGKEGVELKNIKNITNYIAKTAKIEYFGRVA